MLSCHRYLAWGVDTAVGWDSDLERPVVSAVFYSFFYFCLLSSAVVACHPIESGCLKLSSGYFHYLLCLESCLVLVSLVAVERLAS